MVAGPNCLPLKQVLNAACCAATTRVASPTTKRRKNAERHGSSKVGASGSMEAAALDPTGRFTSRIPKGGYKPKANR